MIVPSGPAAAANPGQSIGFSFSPGGLLLPYHMGVADCLIAGSQLYVWVELFILNVNVKNVLLF